MPLPIHVSFTSDNEPFSAEIPNLSLFDVSGLDGGIIPYLSVNRLCYETGRMSSQDVMNNTCER